MLGTYFVLYFLLAPPQSLLRPAPVLLIAHHQGQILRWHSSGHANVRHGALTLARFSAPTLAVADFQDPGFLRLTLQPDVADNSLVYPQSAREIFVNARKIGCREEGPLRRLYYPVLQNREPCEK